MGRRVGGVGPVDSVVSPVGRHAQRLAEGQARLLGGAGNLTSMVQVARQTQRDRDLFTAERERPSRAGLELARAAAAAATGDQERPPRRTWRDLLDALRRRRRR